MLKNHINDIFKNFAMGTQTIIPKKKMSNLNNLAFNIADATLTSITAKGIDWLQTTLARAGRDKHTKYYYDKDSGGSIVNVLTRKAAGMAVNMLSDEAKKLYDNFINKKRKDELHTSAKTSHYQTLIDKTYVNEHEKYGKVEVNGGKNTILAYDAFGNVCTDALMLSIPVKEPIRYYSQKWQYERQMQSNGSYTYNLDEKKSEQTMFNSDHLVWYDTTALVSMSSNKELVLTKVQGRDYTRKELISNGDLSFSITGHITSEQPDIYPSDEVKKFFQLMRYKGVIDVNNQYLAQFGVTKIVIVSFSLPTKEGYKSQQDYSFEAVGIQPDKEVVVNQDTISIINEEMVEGASMDDVRWSRLLSNKLDALKDFSAGALSQGLALAGGYLDSELDTD